MTDKKLTTRQARQALVFGSDDEREGVKQELATIASSDIADVMSWDEQGRVSLRRRLTFRFMQGRRLRR